MNSISLMNNILAQSVRYGAQIGGFYSMNIEEEKEAIEEWLKFFNLEDNYEVVFGDYIYSDGYFMYGIPQIKLK